MLPETRKEVHSCQTPERPALCLRLTLHVLLSQHFPVPHSAGFIRVQSLGLQHFL